MQQYRIREAMVAVARDANGHMKIISLPTGTELVVAPITLQSGLVDVLWEEQTVSIFVQDLKARGDLIRSTAA